MMEIGRTTRWRVMGFSNGQMDEFTQVNFKTIKNMEKECTHGLTGESTMENSLKVSKIKRGHLNNQMGEKLLVYGKREEKVLLVKTNQKLKIIY